MLQKIIVSLALISSFFIATSETEVVYEAPEIIEEVMVMDPPAPAIIQLVERVELYPDMVPICACESSYEGTRYGKPQQFEKDGVTVRYGRVNPDDRGMCQINTKYWLKQSLDLGWDIETEDGNIRMANWIYDHHGTQPWSWSKSCWQK